MFVKKTFQRSEQLLHLPQFNYQRFDFPADVFYCCFHLQDVVIVGEALQLLVLCLQLRTQLMGEITFCAINGTRLCTKRLTLLSTGGINIKVII